VNTILNYPDDQVHKNEMGGACCTYEGEKSTQSEWLESLKKRDNLGDQSIDERIILKRISKKLTGILYWIDLSQDRDK
jgi:hypothetical protein